MYFFFHYKSEVRVTGETLSFFSVSQNSGVNLCDVKPSWGGKKGGREEGRKKSLMSHTELTIWTNQFY